jgi:hypothetical protein
MSPRNQKIVLGVLLVLLVVVYFWNKNSVDSIAGVSAGDVQFTPLNVQQPELRVDLLDKIQKSTYGNGPHRNIFAIGPAPLEVASQSGPQVPKGPQYPNGPRLPAPPQPPQIPAQFFGTASMPASGRHVAFFQSGEDVVVVAEGDTFLTRYRLVHIANESADVMEIASGRHATVPLVPPVVDQAANEPPNQPQVQNQQPNQDVAQ